MKNTRKLVVLILSLLGIILSPIAAPSYLSNHARAAAPAQFASAPYPEKVSQTGTEPPFNIRYSVHMQTYEWTGWRNDGDIAGRPGEGLRMEAIMLDLDDSLPTGMEVQYQVYIEGTGWTNWQTERTIGGTVYQAKRLEAVRIKLVNAPAGYQVRYSVYVQDSGWTPVVYDGEIAGAIGQEKKLEALKIELAAGQPFPLLGLGKYVRALEVQEPYLYAVTYTPNTPNTSNLVVVDVSNPLQPSLLGQSGVLPNIDASDLTVQGNYAFVAGNTDGLWAIDVSNPTLPVLVDSLPLSGAAEDVVVSGSIAAVNVGSAVELVDIANPADLKLLAAYLVSDWPHLVTDIEIQGQFLYFVQKIITPTLRITALDISTPETPREAGYYDIVGAINARELGNGEIEIRDNIAYVGLIAYRGSAGYTWYTEGEMFILDVSNPQNIVQTYHAEDTSLSLSSMQLRKNKLYGTKSYSNKWGACSEYLERIDVGNSESPTPNKETIYESCGAIYFRVSDQYIYFVHGKLLYIYDINTNQPVEKLSNKVYLPGVEAQYNIRYSVHMQNYDWTGWVPNGSAAGRPGEGLRMEAIIIDLGESMPKGMDVTYQAHVQNIGWMPWVTSNVVAGTVNQAKRLEAVRIKLVHAPAGYQARYSVYVQDSGWTPFVYDGEIAGTVGQEKRLEAIKIEIVQPAPLAITQ